MRGVRQMATVLFNFKKNRGQTGGWTDMNQELKVFYNLKTGVSGGEWEPRIEGIIQFK